jgi:hypothetical protein
LAAHGQNQEDCLGIIPEWLHGVAGGVFNRPVDSVHRSLPALCFDAAAVSCEPASQVNAARLKFAAVGFGIEFVHFDT